MATKQLLAILSCLTAVHAHSWLACVDYAEKNAETYDHSKCRGYARNAINLAAKGGQFGQDTGMDYRPSESKPCRDSRNDNIHYNFNHPKAVYYRGQQVVIAHPMKSNEEKLLQYGHHEVSVEFTSNAENHGSDSCTNAFIPDHGNFIYRSERGATADPTLSGFQQNLVANLGIKDPNLQLGQYPRPGYQNAPAFCSNTDKSLGTYSFNVPTNLEAGEYTFIWLWAFNSPNDLYSGCFEVEIVDTLSERNSKLLANGFSDTYEPCGGSTSDFSVPGNSNPGCSNVVTSGTITTIATTSTAATTKSTTTTITPTNSRSLVVNSNQITGTIEVGTPAPTTVRRYLKLKWECPGIDVKFWGARVTSEHSDAAGATYELLQEGADVSSGQVQYHASFGQQGCNQLSYPALATLVKEE